jgi:hypothetical protein
MGLKMFVQDGHIYNQGQELRRIEKTRTAGTPYDTLGGMCLNLSINWLIFCKNDGDPIDALNILKPEGRKREAITKQIANNQIAYHRGVTGQHKQAKTTIDTIFQLSQREGASKLHTNFPSSFGASSDEMKEAIKKKATNHLIPGSGDDLLLIIFNCKAGAHAVAAYATSKECYLFDPNYGLMISTDNIDANRFGGFIEEMVKTYEIADGCVYDCIS